MHVLVSAASRHGATAELGRAIAESLESAGLDVDVRAPREVDSLDEYDAVVLGSAVYYGRWIEEATGFVERHADALAIRRVWLFSSGPLGDPPKPEGEPTEAGALRERTRARDHRVFPGRLVKRGLSIGERVIVAGVRAPEGDYRPWDDVRAWSNEIAEALSVPVTR